MGRRASSPISQTICLTLTRPNLSEGRPSSYRQRLIADADSLRFVRGTKATWLKNGTLWTGQNDGEEILKGYDVLLDGGAIRKVGQSSEIEAYLASNPSFKDRKNVDEVELDGAWVTPGIVDLHSHMGVDAAPSLEGSDDTNSLKAAVLPWLRSLDGFNTHDLAFNLSISGGITTMLVLPGSAGNIGGERGLCLRRCLARC